jgi:6-phosphogluconolactonase
MVTTTRSLLICTDASALAAKAADFIARCAREAIEGRRRFLLALAGGSTPEKAYTLLAEPGRRDTIAWEKAYFFFGDERFVPPGHAASNYEMARRALLSRAPVPASHVFRVPTEANSAAEGAAKYAVELAQFFSVEAGRNILPRFDLMLLGLGEDGHTASLFPGSPALDVDDAWVTWSRPGRLPPPVDRITLTYPVLNAARHVLFLVAGAEKAAVLRDVLEGSANRNDCPVAGVQPSDGTVTWLVDENAARLLTRKGNVKETVL